MAHVFASREESGDAGPPGLEEAGRGAYQRWLRLRKARAVDMREEVGGPLPTGIRPTPDLEQLWSSTLRPSLEGRRETGPRVP